MANLIKANLFYKAAILALLLGGCGEPSARGLKNRQEFEALLTAVALKSRPELDKDARRLEARHDSGDLSDTPHEALQEIIKLARAGDWATAETKAYAFREANPYFE